MIKALVNNKWKKISPEHLQFGVDAFAFEQGLYETFRTLDYKPVFLAPHLDRIFHSATITGLAIHYTKKKVLDALKTAKLL